MVFDDLDYNSGNGNIIAEHSPEEKSAPDVSVEEFSSYFHVTGEIKSLGASVISPKTVNCGKKYCTLLDDVQHATWPNILKYHCHDVYYNLNSSCEELEASVYRLVKFDTNSLACKKFASRSPNFTKEDKEMLHNKKRNICELLFTSPERRKLSLQTIESNSKKFKEVQRCNITSTSQIRQIALIPGKKNVRKKSIKACIQTSFKLNFNKEINSEHSSTHIAESSISSRGCRKSLFKSQTSPQTLGSVSNSQINPNMSIDWSIRKNRSATRNRTKPMLTLNAEKCISPSNENKYKLSLRKGLQRTMFLNDDCNISNGESNEKKDGDFLSSESKSFCRFDSMSSDDMQKFQQTERLSDRHKKKLREAVANALESNGINLDHPLFKTYGRNLFAICKNHLKDVIGKGRTSIQMKKLAEIYVKKVIQQEANKL